MTDDPRDKRRFERYAVRWKLRFASPELSCDGRTADISQNGLSFHSDIAIPHAAKARISLRLPPGKLHPYGHELSADVRVVYSVLQGKSGFRIGLEFTHIEEKSAATLSKTLAHLQAISNEII